MSTPRTRELFYHKDQQAQWMNHKIEVVTGIFEQVEQDFHKSYDVKDLQIKVPIDMGPGSSSTPVFTRTPAL